MDKRKSLISSLDSAKPSDGGIVLSHRMEVAKLGVKGPNLAPWAEGTGIELPQRLYDVKRVDEDGVLVRVGGDEIIFESKPGNPLFVRIEQALNQPTQGVYRIEQQASTIEICGPLVHRALAQTCGLNFSREPAERIVYTRVAGASCGVIPLETSGGRIYRIWIDYSLTPYLWEVLNEIAADVVKEHQAV